MPEESRAIGPIATTPVRTGPMTHDVAVPSDEEMDEPPPEEASEESGRDSDVSVASQDSDGVARIAFLTTRVEGLKTKAAGKRRKEKRGKLLNFRKETPDVQQELLKSRAAEWRNGRSLRQLPCFRPKNCRSTWTRDTSPCLCSE